MNNNYYVDRYIRVNNYEEYINLLNYWKEKLPDYEIIHTVDTDELIANTNNSIEEIFNSERYSMILVAAWISEDDRQLEIDIYNNNNIDKSLVNYINILARRGDIILIDNKDIKKG